MPQLSCLCFEFYIGWSTAMSIGEHFMQRRGEHFSRRGALKRFLTLCRINCLPLQCGWILTKSGSHIPILSSLVCEAVWIVYYVAQHLFGLKNCLKMCLVRYLQQLMLNSHYTAGEAIACRSTPKLSWKI